MEVQRFPWPFVELTRYAVEVGLGVRRQIGSVNEVLPQQPVGVFIGTALPRTLRIAEINGVFGFRAFGRDRAAVAWVGYGPRKVRFS